MRLWQWFLFGWTTLYFGDFLFLFITGTCIAALGIPGFLFLFFFNCHSPPTMAGRPFLILCLAWRRERGGALERSILEDGISSLLQKQAFWEQKEYGGEMGVGGGAKHGK